MISRMSLKKINSKQIKIAASTYNYSDFCKYILQKLTINKLTQNNLKIVALFCGWLISTHNNCKLLNQKIYILSCENFNTDFLKTIRKNTD